MLGPMVLLLAACTPPKNVQIEELVRQGYPDLACTLEQGEYAELADETVASGATVKVSSQVVPASAFVVVPEGYGTEWWLVNLGVEQHGAVDRVELSLELPGYAHRAFDPDELAKRYPRPPRDTRAEPNLEGDVSSSWGDTWKAAKVIGSLLVLPYTAVWDLTMFMTDLHDGKLDGNVPYLTPHLALFQIPASTADGGTRSPVPSFGRLVESPAGLGCSRDLCSTQLVVERSPRHEQARLSVTLHAQSCSSTRSAVLPQVQGELEDVLAELFPPQGAELEWAGW